MIHRAFFVVSAPTRRNTGVARDVISRANTESRVAAPKRDASTSHA